MVDGGEGDGLVLADQFVVADADDGHLFGDLEADGFRCGEPTTLGEKGVTEADIPGIVADVKTVSFNAAGVLASYPPVTEEMLAEILRGAL